MLTSQNNHYEIADYTSEDSKLNTSVGYFKSQNDKDRIVQAINEAMEYKGGEDGEISIHRNDIISDLNFDFLNLRKIRNVKIGNYEVNLVLGSYKKEGDTDNKEKKSTSLPAPVRLTGNCATKRYYLYLAVLKLLYHEELDAFICRTLEACIKLYAYRLYGLSSIDLNISNFLHNVGPAPFKHPLFLTRSESEILTDIWVLCNMDNQLGSPHLFVGDSLNQVQVYRYTGSVPTYEKVPSSQMIVELRKFLNTFYEGFPPKKLMNNIFLKDLQKYMSLSALSSKDTFLKNKAKVGLPFRNCFVEVLERGKCTHRREYSADIYSGDNIIQADYEDPVLVNGEIALSENVKCYLENISNGSPYILTVFRGWLRTLITTQYDGRNYQSCLYISGPPGTAKTAFVEMAKRFVNDKSKICEFSRDQDQFTGGSLDSCELLIISDLQYINVKQLQFIKQVLGRDTMAKQVKYDPEFSTISPYCQVVIVSNYKPTDFREFREDQATLDKLIHVEFPAESAVPQIYQIPGLANYLDPMMSEIFNWVIYTPGYVLNYHKRAVLYNAHSSEEVVLMGMAGFIEENLIFDPSPSAFMSIPDLAIKLEEYAEETGDTSVIFPKSGAKTYNATAIKRQMENAFVNVFGRTIKYEKFSRRDKDRGRPWGYSNVGFKKHGKTLENGQEDFKRVQQVGMDNFKLPFKWAASTEIEWLAVSKSQFFDTQRKLYQYRLIATRDREEREKEQQQMDIAVEVPNLTLPPETDLTPPENNGEDLDKSFQEQFAQKPDIPKRKLPPIKKGKYTKRGRRCE